MYIIVKSRTSSEASPLSMGTGLSPSCCLLQVYSCFFHAIVSVSQIVMVRTCREKDGKI